MSQPEAFIRPNESSTPIAQAMDAIVPAFLKFAAQEFGQSHGIIPPIGPLFGEPGMKVEFLFDRTQTEIQELIRATLQQAGAQAVVNEDGTVAGWSLGQAITERESAAPIEERLRTLMGDYYVAYGQWLPAEWSRFNQAVHEAELASDTHGSEFNLAFRTDEFDNGFFSINYRPIPLP